MSTSLKRLMEEDAARPVPPAPIEGVLARGRSRVRRRRAVGSMAAAVLAVLAIAIPVAFLGNDSSDRPIGPPGSGSLTFTREDGSTFRVDGARAICRPPSETDSDVQLIEVWAGLPQQQGSDGLPPQSYFHLTAPVDEVSDGATMSSPDEDIKHPGYQSPALYAYDADADSDLSSSAEDASGSIDIKSASCDPEPAIDVTIDATLGGEAFEGKPVRVVGRLTIG